MRHARSLGLAVVVMVVSATACTESPTATINPAIRLDATGPGLGSGHVVPDNQTAVASYETKADTTGRNGLGFGSGH